MNWQLVGSSTWSISGKTIAQRTSATLSCLGGQIPNQQRLYSSLDFGYWWQWCCSSCDLRLPFRLTSQEIRLDQTTSHLHHLRCFNKTNTLYSSAVLKVLLKHYKSTLSTIAAKDDYEIPFENLNSIKLVWNKIYNMFDSCISRLHKGSYLIFVNFEWILIIFWMILGMFVSVFSVINQINRTPQIKQYINRIKDKTYILRILRFKMFFIGRALILYIWDAIQR